ncbi:MAG: hypothetical protein BAJATHORv1_60015 [Candidatus Thorarchaeota archaeon]|nr:MAG: hypothetical protein BAJATHORv1_60015 [Candidatus Thorarchaeota archaeon]
MVRYPNESLRPTKIRTRKEGAFISFRPPKDDVKIKEWKVFRSMTYDYKTGCSELIEGSGDFNELFIFTLDDSATMLVDREVEPKTSYSYYVFAVDKKGNYHFPGYCVGKVIEDGLPMIDGGEPTFSSEPKPLKSVGDYSVSSSERKKLIKLLKKKTDSSDKIDWAESVLDALDTRDEQGYWIAVKIGMMEPDVFLMFVDSTDDLVMNSETLVHELTHVGSTIQYVIRDKHLRIPEGGSGYIYLIDDHAIGCSIPRSLFYRQEILQALDDRDDFDSEYLGHSGKQDFQSVLNELNAYCRGLRTTLRLIDQMPSDSPSITHRLLKFMLYTQMYLKIARQKYPEDYKLIAQSKPLLLILQKIWDNCEYLIEEASRYELGRDELYDVVNSRKNLSELTRLYELAGLELYGSKPIKDIGKLAEAHSLAIVSLR